MSTTAQVGYKYILPGVIAGVHTVYEIFEIPLGDGDETMELARTITDNFVTQIVPTFRFDEGGILVGEAEPIIHTVNAHTTRVLRPLDWIGESIDESVEITELETGLLELRIRRYSHLPTVEQE